MTDHNYNWCRICQVGKNGDNTCRDKMQGKYFQNEQPECCGRVLGQSNEAAEAKRQLDAIFKASAHKAHDGVKMC